MSIEFEKVLLTIQLRNGAGEDVENAYYPWFSTMEDVGKKFLKVLEEATGTAKVKPKLFRYEEETDQVDIEIVCNSSYEAESFTQLAEDTFCDANIPGQDISIDDKIYVK